MGLNTEKYGCTEEGRLQRLLLEDSTDIVLATRDANNRDFTDIKIIHKIMKIRQNTKENFYSNDSIWKLSEIHSEKWVNSADSISTRFQLYSEFSRISLEMMRRRIYKFSDYIESVNGRYTKFNGDAVDLTMPLLVCFVELDIEGLDEGFVFESRAMTECLERFEAM
ncbi:MAG: hypothetical protein AAGC81_02125 [Pseudomonadota bacterium]